MIRKKERTNTPLLLGGMWGDAILSSPAGHGIAQTLANWINTPNTTAYDKAIDSIYLQTHVGGSGLHHLVDGQHDIFGAFEAASKALPNDGLWQEITGTGIHLTKDLFSVSGLPVISLDPNIYAESSDWISNHLRLSKSWQADFLQVNALELFSGFLTTAAVLVGYRHPDIKRLSELSGASGLASLLSANPIAMGAAAFALLLAWKHSRRNQSGLMGKHLIVGAGSSGSAYLSGIALGALGVSGGFIPIVGTLGISFIMGLFARSVLIKLTSSTKVKSTTYKQDFLDELSL